MSDKPKADHAPGAISRARRLRRDMTASERHLWKALRALNLHIRRQAPVGRYIADFIHHGACLVIEVDSAWHDSLKAQERDALRDAWFQSQGYRVLRFRDREVFSDPYAIADRVAVEIQQSPPSQPFPHQGGRAQE
ncbi:MAG: hypothetical protein B7Z44_06390 [Caulobacter sp. 12-67-6]|nr:MAG: hypothetical protein B7Z44_06390 [Caulobacter sp. 12-67-6]OYX69647.1 MAG: hypothetical protein B7Y81_13540 [Caulobacter sp. 32-67-35]OYX97531.1 MAG: hypothetical protein B7Y78_01905 [Caulobacter sp. 35-67-4]OZA72989.1 MAG: hypothetical protein B7X77_10745 [Caulobacter sp. 39-67-4]HQR90650.1 DUF559 domain-containing protein [Caulobacter sp.]